MRFCNKTNQTEPNRHAYNIRCWLLTHCDWWWFQCDMHRGFEYTTHIIPKSGGFSSLYYKCAWLTDSKPKLSCLCVPIWVAQQCHDRCHSFWAPFSDCFFFISVFMVKCAQSPFNFSLYFLVYFFLIFDCPSLSPRYACISIRFELNWHCHEIQHVNRNA